MIVHGNSISLKITEADIEVAMFFLGKIWSMVFFFLRNLKILSECFVVPRFSARQKSKKMVQICYIVQLGGKN